MLTQIFLFMHSDEILLWWYEPKNPFQFARYGDYAEILNIYLFIVDLSCTVWRQRFLSDDISNNSYLFSKALTQLG